MQRHISTFGPTNLEWLLSQTPSYLIPILKRQYMWNWGSEEDPGSAQQLFLDIKNRDVLQFGIFIFHDKESGEKRIIDGQQRLITCTLFLRAALQVINEFDREEEKSAFERQKIHIEDCLFYPSFPKIRPEFTYSYFAPYERIICGQQGEHEGACNNFIKNYQSAYKELKQMAIEPGKLENFIDTLLNIPIPAVIDTDSEEMAQNFLKNSSASNPVEDMDFFKGKLFSYFPTSAEGKKEEEFTSVWSRIYEKSLEAFPSSDTNGEPSFQSLLLFYQSILPKKTGWPLKEENNRKFFSRGDDVCLKDAPHVMENLENICNSVITYRTSLDLGRELESQNAKADNLFSALLSTKYDLILCAFHVFLMSNPDAKSVETFLKGIVSLYILFMASAANLPCNAADGLGSLCLHIINHLYGLADCSKEMENLRGNLSNHRDEFKKRLCQLKYKLTNTKTHLYLKTLLLFNTALKPPQGIIIDKTLTLDHIYPKSRECWPDETLISEECDGLINSLGNLVLLEHDLNLRKANSGRETAIDIYDESQIVDTAEVKSEMKFYEWDKTKIQTRLEEVSQRLLEKVETGLKSFVEMSKENWGFTEEQRKRYADLVKASPKDFVLPYSNYVAHHMEG